MSKSKAYDLGIRNALIANFNPLEIRNDLGALFENYMVLERLKLQTYKPILANNYFWRTWNQEEIDWLEEREGSLFAYDFKWQQKKAKVPKTWQENYPDAHFETVNRDNYLPFVTA